VAATVHVIGLGPGPDALVTIGARAALISAPVARLRTRRHPSASAFTSTPSYDEWYDTADSFDELYRDIANDLVRLALDAPDGRVVYAVPGSPSVAERTVELLRARDDVVVVVDAAVSVVDVACARLGVDAMASHVRAVDALDPAAWSGAGPWLVLQAHSREVLALVADRLTPDTEVTVLHHLGLDDEVITRVPARRLASEVAADHLTSLWVSGARSPGAAFDELVDLARVLRERCAWDREQTVASLSRHLLEESYEVIDALDAYVANGESDAVDVIEELGDLLYQVVFQAQLGFERDQFTAASIADTVTAKLVARHPHVFDGATAPTAADAARQWEELKRREKQRGSSTDGVPAHLPALAQFDRLRRTADAVGVVASDAPTLARVRDAVDHLAVPSVPRRDVVGTDEQWETLMSAVSDLAHFCGVDLESVERHCARRLRAEIVAHESRVIVRDDDAE
jgi:tetrapyrrole methylase family protein / MazG family protein